MPFNSNRNSRDDNSRKGRSNSESFGSKSGRYQQSSSRGGSRKSDSDRSEQRSFDHPFKKFDKRENKSSERSSFNKFDKRNDERSSFNRSDRRDDRNNERSSFNRSDRRDDRNNERSSFNRSDRRDDRNNERSSFNRSDRRDDRNNERSSFNRSDRRDDRNNERSSFNRSDRRDDRNNERSSFNRSDRRDDRNNERSSFNRSDRRDDRNNERSSFNRSDRRDDRNNERSSFNRSDRRDDRNNERSSFNRSDRRDDRNNERSSFNRSDRRDDRNNERSSFNRSDRRDDRNRGGDDRNRKSFGRSNRNYDRSRGGEDNNGRTFYPKKKFAITEPKDDGLIRLNRYISNSGVCSRRKADELIESGVVSVNGEVVTELGTKVDPAKDEIRYNGERLKREKMVYVLLNKPKDYITTTDDPQERKTVMQLVEKATKERIYPVGRLDRNTTGLLLITNDGNLAEKLSHPRNSIGKIYNVELNKNLTQGDFNKIQFGIELEDGFVKPDDLSYVAGASKSEVGIQIHSGKNRIVRRIFESLGYDVIKLDRVVYANLTKKDLPRGRWRYLEEHELIQLKHFIK